MQALLPVALGAALALLCLWAAWRVRRRRRLLEDIPTCKTQGVFIGLVELKGTAESLRPLRSRLAETECVHYAWIVEEHWSRTVTETYRDEKGASRTRTRTESGWKTVDQGGGHVDFHLQDDTGAVRVRPEGAKIEALTVFDETCHRGEPLYYGKGPEGSVAHSDHRRRFQETAIPLGTPLYVVGQSREREDVVAPEIAESPNAPLFLISTRTEKQVAAGLGWQGWAWGIFGLLLAVGGAGVGVNVHLDGAPDTGSLAIASALAAGLYLLACLLAWVWLVYNALVDLRHRVRQAWSLVDVELKRRNDLIPGLVACVQGYRDHEAALQRELAALRAQQTATAPGEPGPDPRACRSTLLAIAERYPDLKAQDSFLKLQESLIETEQRIALARGYYNEIASFHNVRLEVLPDVWIARPAGLRPQLLLTADGFEREPVALDFRATSPGNSP